MESLKKNQKNSSNFSFYGPFLFMLVVIIGWAVFFYYVSPTTVVKMIGIQNSYLVAFLLAAICGFSSLTGTTFYVAIAALAVGGANPLILGIVGGLGLCLSDFLFYLVIRKGTHVVDKHWESFSNFIKRWIQIIPSWLLSLFIFLYSGFFPIPNDVLLITLAVGGIPMKKIIPYLFAGDIVSTLILTYLSH